MKVISFIKENGLQALAQWAIEIRDYPDRVVLNYSHLETPRFHPLADECRALILQKGTWKVLARSFDRFYNLGEIPPENKPLEEQRLHSSGLKIQEKVDGSLISVYHDGDTWCCSTRSMAFAEGNTARGNTFKTVFERAIGAPLNQRFSGTKKEHTYVFELVSPETRVVKPYPKDGVYLLTVRENIPPYREFSLDATSDVAKGLEFAVPKNYSFNDPDQMLASLKELPAMDEGYVARLDTPEGVWRTKIKNPSYLAISNIRCNGAISDKRLAILVLNGGETEYVGYFPEDDHLFVPYRLAKERMLTQVENLWKETKDIASQKDFAMKVKDTPVGFILFSLRKGGTIDGILDKISDDAKLSLLERFKY